MHMCRSRGARGNMVNAIEVDEQQEVKEKKSDTDEEELNMDLFIGMLQGHNSGGSKLWYTTLRLEDQDVEFKLDTGSEADLMPV